MNFFRTTSTGYKWDKRIFWMFFGGFTCFCIYLMAANSFNFSSTNIYIECKEDSCKNPLMEIDGPCNQQINILWFIPLYKTKDCKDTCTEDWCSMEYLPKGSYGKKPSPFMQYIWLEGILVILLSIATNHFTHNRGKKLDFGVMEYWKEQMPWLKKLKKIDSGLEDDDEDTKDNSKE